MSGIKLACTECTTEFEAENINVKKNQAFCNHCSLLFPLDEIKRNSTDTSYKIIGGGVEGIYEYEDQEGYSIEVTWRNFSLYKFHLICGAIVTLFTFPFAIILLLKFEILVALLCGLFSILGLWLLHMGLQEYYNKSMLFIDDQEFTIYHQPFSLFLSSIKIPKEEINQFFIKRVDAGSSNGVQHYKHQLWLKTNSNKEEKVLALFKDEREAFYVEHLLEKHLGISDVIIANEHTPGALPKIDQHAMRFAQALHQVRNERNKK